MAAIVKIVQDTHNEIWCKKIKLYVGALDTSRGGFCQQIVDCSTDVSGQNVDEKYKSLLLTALPTALPKCSGDCRPLLVGLDDYKWEKRKEISLSGKSRSK